MKQFIKSEWLEYAVGALVGVALLWLVSYLFGFSARICEIDHLEQCHQYNFAAAGLLSIVEHLNWLSSTVLALATIAVAWYTYTLKESHDKLWHFAQKTAEATKLSADATKKSADALPTIERAHVFMVHDQYNFVEAHSAALGNLAYAMVDKKLAISFRFTNPGKTPAVIKEVCYQLVVLPVTQEPDGYQTISPLPCESLLGSERSTSGITLNAPELTGVQAAGMVDDEGFIVWFWGKVCYEDIFQGRHETYFCLRYYPADHRLVPWNDDLNRRT